MLKAQPTILIIEKDLVTLELYARELGRDFQVLACSGTHEALTIIHDRKLSAIVLEPATLGDEGWELLETIKSFPDSWTTPVIICSVMDERKRALEMGVVTCLMKPVLLSKLIETLEHVIEAAQENTVAQEPRSVP
jgi:DNA-binding response OmpR family regulator